MEPSWFFHLTGYAGELLCLLSTEDAACFPLLTHGLFPVVCLLRNNAAADSHVHIPLHNWASLLLEQVL
jgi:hypothetical protein